MASCSWVQNPIVQLRTIAIIFIFSYVIIWHSCHRCVYFEVIVIVTIVFRTIAIFLETYFLVFLFAVFRWLGTFCDKMIFGSATKAFPIWTIWNFVWRSTSRKSFPFFFLIFLKHFFHRMVRKSTICALCLDRVCFFVVFTGSWLTAVKIQIFCL